MASDGVHLGWLDHVRYERHADHPDEIKKRQLLSDQQWKLVNTEEKQNEELLGISNEILTLTREVHKLTSPGKN